MVTIQIAMKIIMQISKRILCGIFSDIKTLGQSLRVNESAEISIIIET